MSETVEACPNCDTTSGIYTRDGNPRRGFGCRECGETFEQPTIREPKHTTNTQKGLAKELSDTEPGDL